MVQELVSWELNMKIAIVLLIAVQLVFAKESFVEAWRRDVIYENWDIVFYESAYYLAPSTIENVSPDKGWIIISNFNSPYPFMLDSLYEMGDAVLYNNTVCVAGKVTQGRAPSVHSEQHSWVIAKGPVTKLPAHPGISGDTTLLGIDSDNDGIRDDIQVALTLLLPYDAEIRAAYLAKAKALLMGHEVFDSVPDFTPADFGLALALQQVALFKEDDSVEGIRFRDIQWMVNNTPERISAVDQISQMFNGVVMGQELRDHPEAYRIFDEILARELERQQ